MAELIRLVAAGARAGSTLSISTAQPLPAQLVQLLRAADSPVRVDDITVENEGLWLARAAAGLLQGQVAEVPDDDLSLLERATQDSGVLTLGVQNTVALDRQALLHADPGAHLDGPGAGSYRGLRIRLVGGSAHALATAVGGSCDVAIYSDEVTESGRVELLPFLREQSLSITAHRFGNPMADIAALRF